MSYFLIEASPDGITIQEVTKEMVLDTLAEELDYNYNPECRLATRLKPCIPSHIDPYYWGDSAILIKGEIVVPRAAQIVTEHEID